MKKIFSLILCVFSMMLLTSCSRPVIDSRNLSTSNSHVSPEPDTLPPLEALPKALRTKIGKTQTVFLPSQGEDIPFAYYYNKETGLERLVVVSPFVEDVSQLTIYAPNFGGIRNFTKNLQTQFEAVLLETCYISIQEATYIKHSALRSEEEADVEKEIIKLPGAPDNPNSLEFYCGILDLDFENSSWGTGQSVWQEIAPGTAILISGNLQTSASISLQKSMETFRRVYERYGITNAVSTEDTEWKPSGTASDDPEDPVPLPPGTLPAVDEIPKAVKTGVGKSRSVSLLSHEKNVVFAYYYDKATAKEWLVVVSGFLSNVSQLTIYEPAFGGVQNFTNSLGMSFNAVLLDVCYISTQEAGYLLSGALRSEEDADVGKEIVNLHEAPDNPNSLEFYCGILDLDFENSSWGTGQSVWQEIAPSAAVLISGNLQNDQSEELRTGKETFERVYARFGLEDAFITSPI